MFVALVIAVLAVDVGYDTITPLRRGAFFGAGAGADDLCTPPDPLVCAHFRFAPGATVVFGGEVRNAGPLPVTIVGAPDETTAMVASKRLLLTADSESYDLVATVPFAPLRLAPGDHRVIVEERVLQCPPPGGPADGRAPIVIDAVRLRYRLLALEHETAVPLLGQVVIDGPDATACPGS
jgi:hypothetical protein